MSSLRTSVDTPLKEGTHSLSKSGMPQSLLENTKEAEMNQEGKYRILRVLEYVGDRDWVDEQIAKRGVKGSFILRNKRGLIREAIIGDVAELLNANESAEDYNQEFADSLEQGDSV